jgi:hypothetical protein
LLLTPSQTSQDIVIAELGIVMLKVRLYKAMNAEGIQVETD